jgi:hypothetical protein
MISEDTLFAFFDEIEKAAALSKDELRNRRRAYYRSNREALLAKGRAYRRANIAQIKRKRILYERRVKSGSKRKRRRIQTGMSYEFAGYY